jgi:hypothetical protein
MKCKLCLFLLFAAPVWAQFTYAPINVPGALGTEARGVNVYGEVAGFYKTTTCTDYNVLVTQCPVKGFRYVNGSYLKLMVPGSVSTAILGLNDYGDLVGYYSKMQSGCSRPVYHGFIWYHQNVVRTIDAPGTGKCPTSNGGPVTAAMGINKAGTVVGGIWATGQLGTFPNTGWVWVNGTFSNMNPESPGAAAPCCWSVNGIANNGVISGNVFQADFFMAWFKEAKDEDFYEYFPSTQTGGDTYGTGVNSKTDTVGYSPSGGGYFAKQIEANEGTTDTEPKMTFVKVAYPNAVFTYPFSVNDLRWVAGTYVDSHNVYHGFIAKATF